MARLIVIAVGQRLPDWADAACREYLRRMPREMPVELLELKAEARSAGRLPRQILEAERGRIMGVMPVGAQVIALDERGALWTTRELAQQLQQAASDGETLAFLIGGADGLHDDLKANARAMLSLSRLTLPHALARVVLAEQLYRASSLLRNHPYHRE